MRRSLIVLLCLCLLGLTGAARAGMTAAPGFDSIGDATLIPDGVVSSLAEDAQGFLWIGTAGGLVRYDGHRFRLFSDTWSVPGETASMFVRSLAVTRDGTLWVGTDFSGLAIYDPRSETFRAIDVDGDRTPLAASSVNAIVEDFDRHVWVGTAGHGLIEWQPGGNARRHLPGGPGGLPDEHVQSLLVDSAGDLWIGSWNGLSRKRRGAARIETLAATGDAAAAVIRGDITQLFEAADGRLWVGTRSGDLLVLDRQRLHARALPSATADDRAARSTVYAFVQPEPDQVWVGRAGGIEIHDARSGDLLRHVRHDPAQPRGLAGNEVRAMLRDRAGLIWAGGYGGGVQRHNPGNRAFQVRGYDHTPGSPLADPNVRSVLALADGRILLGTQDGGIAVLDRDLQLQGALLDVEGQPVLRGGRVTGLAEAADGQLWLGGDAGLFRYNPTTRRLRPYPIGQGRTRRLLLDAQQRLWAATQDGLFRHVPAVDAMQRVEAVSGPPISGDVNALAMDADGRVWIGGDQGIAEVEPGEERLRWIDMFSGARAMQSEVLGLLPDADGSVWFDTPAGLYRLQRQPDHSWQALPVSAPLGLEGHPFGANLLKDAQGRLWSHQHVYDPASQRLEALSIADGVDIGTGWFRAYAAAADGRLLFGGSRGLLVIDPTLYRTSEYEPPLVVSELKIDGNRVSAGDLGAGLRLLPGQRSIAIEFAALDFSAPERCIYEFRLHGYDPDWTRSDAAYRVASYGNLPPGDYTLEIRGSNRNGRWSAHRLRIPLQVEPSWWQTWWFRALLLTGGALVVATIVQLRTSMLRSRQRELEQRVQERTAELQAVSEALQQKSEALEQASLTDPLTGLRNRRFLSAYVDADVAQALRGHDESRRRGEGEAGESIDLVFFLVDLDHFKQVNDVHGHSAGDAVLMQIRERLQRAFRESDYLVRWGGEEFLIVSRGTDRRAAPELAERARRIIAATPFVLPDGSNLFKTCSIGYAAFPLQPRHARALDWSQVVDLADLALLAAKRAGRDGWVGLDAAADPAIGPSQLQQLGELLEVAQLRVLTSLPETRVRAALSELAES